MGGTLKRQSAQFSIQLKPEEGRLSGFDLLPRYLTEWRCLTSQTDVGTGGAEAYLSWLLPALLSLTLTKRIDEKRAAVQANDPISHAEEQP